MYVPWNLASKALASVSRREVDMEASEERDIEQRELGALNKTFAAQVTDIVENDIVSAALADMVCHQSHEWLSLCRTNLSEATALLESAMLQRGLGADTDLGRDLE